MPRFRKILVPIEGDLHSQPVLARAARLASKNGGAIKLISVVEELPWYTRIALPNADELHTHIVRAKSQILVKLVEQLQREGIEASSEVLTGRRYLELAREASRGEYDVLMKEAESHPSMLFGSVDMYLLRSCPCPVWLFKPDHASRGFSKVVAAVDPAPPPDSSDVLHIKEELAPKEESLDFKILEFASELAKEEGSELHIVHAWSAPGEELLQGEAMLSEDQVASYIEESRIQAKKAVDHLLAKSAESDGRRIVHMLNGDPADVITNFAITQNVDLIVMGTVARTGIPGLLIGNTAESILQRVDCSVLAIKPDGFVSPDEIEG